MPEDEKQEVEDTEEEEATEDTDEAEAEEGAEDGQDEDKEGEDYRGKLNATNNFLKKEGYEWDKEAKRWIKPAKAP
jgi:hypothetical protein